MAQYVDGFVIPIPKKSVAAYKKIATQACKVWMDHGALQYFECLGEDLKQTMCGSFPDVIKIKPSETIVFAWIVYKSRAQRDSVNAKVMKDPRMLKMMKKMGTTMPFDPKRMMYGGFKVIVTA